MTIQHQADAVVAARAQVTAEMREFFDALFAGAGTGGLDAADLALIAARARAELLAQDAGAARVTLSETPRFALAVAQRTLTARLLASGETDALENWSRDNREALARRHEFQEAIESAGELSVAKLLLAASQVQNLA